MAATFKYDTQTDFALKEEIGSVGELERMRLDKSIHRVV
jgi:hypothetical protein